jgi:uncharacterized protein YjbI with pentapeptide repeats
MADATHLAKLKEGVAAWNKWRDDNPEIRPDLTNVDLRSHSFRPTARYGPLQAVNLQRADLVRANLQGADLQYANLQNANLHSANLKIANLKGADLQGADLQCANLQAANLRAANLQDANVTGVKFNRSSRQLAYQGIRVSTCYGSQAFKSFAQDQDYVEEFRSSKPKLFLLWWLSADCGRSFIRWALLSLGLTVLFGIFYYRMGLDLIKPDPPLPFSFITMLYYSVVTFTTLGFGDVRPQTELAAIIVMFEVIVGYIMLGGLIAIFANKVARRA